MSPEQEWNLRSIKECFLVLVDDKYRMGAKEHGGDLFDLSELKLLDSAIEEAVDQVVYLLTLRRKLSANKRR